ncbi:hypothetical protein [Deinococcus soli (ex Cha et al. 2016)]|uniref:hypothetical protein n=1 Tax=Deinococcus soli (ex Cha et al. 2016) TaxID=1309411 RepID=UPI001668F63E|nr:hypothetical protein [Deinococcus soli (ex Cha et al. 2016)]GGB64544.1 hypothetical protein GCM10008019_20800 [Deinococcus soli (ex Cha et al. 2016)]
MTKFDDDMQVTLPTLPASPDELAAISMEDLLGMQELLSRGVQLERQARALEPTPDAPQGEQT